MPKPMEHRTCLQQFMFSIGSAVVVYATMRFPFVFHSNNL